MYLSAPDLDVILWNSQIDKITFSPLKNVCFSSEIIVW